MRMRRIPKKVERWVSKELDSVKNNLVMRNNAADYEVFGKYRIIQKDNRSDVYDASILLTTLSSNKVALAWCTASKFNMLNLAHRIEAVDQRLYALKNDIKVRVNIATNSKKEQFKRDLLCKVETKLLRQKQLEYELKECVSLAKYYQQRGFNNETARAS
jgi:hypothetical protein